MYKVCTRCKNSKPLERFSKDKRQRYSRRPECKLCESRSPGRILRNIKQRLQFKPQWYTGITCDLNKQQIAQLPFVCCFCNKAIRGGHHLHRLDHKGNYTLANVAFAHKSCHAKNIR
jgi:hypothetical protein